MKTFDISDIRNKLSPVVNLLALLDEIEIKGDEVFLNLIEQEKKQVIESIKYLTNE